MGDHKPPNCLFDCSPYIKKALGTLNTANIYWTGRRHFELGIMLTPGIAKQGSPCIALP